MSYSTKATVLAAFALVSAAFAWNGDSLASVSLEVRVFPKRILIPSGMSQSVSSRGISCLVFFEDHDTTIGEGWRSELLALGEMLARNPDLVAVIEGYYSPQLEGIRSPLAGRELALRRAEAVLGFVVTRFPQVGDRIVVSDTHDPGAPLGDKPAPWDIRAQIRFQVVGFGERNFYPAARPPFWRRSYKAIVADVAPQLRRIFAKNPDVIAVLRGFGFPNDKTGYGWLSYLRDKLVEKVGKRFSWRFALFVEPFAEVRSPYASLSLLPVGALPNGGFERIDLVPDDFLPQMTCSLRCSAGLPNRFFCAIWPPGRCGLYAVTLAAKRPSVPVWALPLFEGEYAVDVYIPPWGVVDDEAGFAVEPSDSFCCTWRQDVWQFYGDRLSVGSGAALWFVAKAVAAVAPKVDGLKVTVLSHCADDSVGRARLEVMWKSLSAQLAEMLDVKTPGVRRWLVRRGVSVELANDQTLEAASLPEKQLAEGRCTVILEFCGGR